MAESTNTAVLDEVSYREAPTELFLAIEEMEWRDAFSIIASNPEQVKTWVHNVEPDNINSWRRLPVHEACIRRAPAWLVSELLSTFPDSSSLTTNLGEMPLHLSVDKACAPEVVNLVIVANWNAIVAQDHAGRTPLEIIDRTELLEIESNKVIFDSLKRCHTTYMDIQKACRDEKAALVRRQKATQSVVSKRHQEEIRNERTKHAKQKEEIEQLKKELKAARELTEDKDHEIQKHILSKNRYMAAIQDLEIRETSQHEDLEAKKAQIKSLLFKVKQRDGEIQSKRDKIDMLSKDLQRIAVSNETEVTDSLMEAEQSMRQMVSTQIALQKLLSSKSNGLTILLKQRGVPLPDVHRHPEQRQEPPQEEKSCHEDEDAIHDAAANAAMMAAATAALQSHSMK